MRLLPLKPKDKMPTVPTPITIAPIITVSIDKNPFFSFPILHFFIAVSHRS